MANHGMIVADAGRARFFLTDGGLDELEEIFDLVHPEARMPGRDVWTDGHGRRRGSSVEPHTPRRDQEDQVFARQVAAEAMELLERGEQWIVVAPPRFLGALRSALPERFMRRIVAQIDKDLSKLPIHELAPAVRRALPPTAGMA